MSLKKKSLSRLSEMLNIDSNACLSVLEDFLKCEIQRIGVKRAVIGLSGGIDSALAAVIAVKALGPKNVYGIYMPYKTSAAESEQHAELVAKHLGLVYEKRSITEQVDAYFRLHKTATKLRRGNKMARERMSVLYDASQEKNALVVGTSNKTELLLGYGTLFGDMASALNPLGDLYKTQIWALSKESGLPGAVIEKAPSADLWAGQSDEKEMGFGYADVDRLLVGMVDAQMDDEALQEAGFKTAFIRDIRSRIAKSQFKRKLPIVAKLGSRTIGREFRYPRDWGTKGA